MTRLNDNITSALLLVPGIAMLSAAITLDGVLKRTAVITLDVLGIQDYFDKAVDLLIPVFVFFVGAVLAGVIFARLSPDEKDLNATEDEEPNKLPYKRSWKLTIFFACVAIIGIGVVPHHKNTVMLVAAFGVLNPYIFNWFYKIATHNWPKKSDDIFTMSVIAGLVGSATLIGIQHNLEEKLLSAEKSHFETGKIVVLDKYSAGWLILKDGQYHLADSSSALQTISSGSKIESKRSFFCEWIKGPLCFNTIILEEKIGVRHEQRSPNL